MCDICTYLQYPDLREAAVSPPLNNFVSYPADPWYMSCVLPSAYAMLNGNGMFVGCFADQAEENSEQLDVAVYARWVSVG